MLSGTGVAMAAWSALMRASSAGMAALAASTRFCGGGDERVQAPAFLARLFQIGFRLLHGRFGLRPEIVGNERRPSGK